MCFFSGPLLKGQGHTHLEVGNYRVNIILDDKTLQYFRVSMAYQDQQIIYKTMGVSILVSIFKHDSNTHWRKEGWGRLTSKSNDKTP